MALRVPLTWLSDYVDISMSPEELAERLTIAGLEVETVEYVGKDWNENYILVGKIQEVQPHPNADLLSLVTVDYDKDEPITIVTGSPNVRQYEGRLLERSLKVPLALAGATLVDPHSEDGQPLRLKSTMIREVRSDGMLCSERELGIGDDHEGILFLPEDAPIGMSLKEYLGDAVLTFDIKGGFSHLLSILGIARETAALTASPLDKQSPREILPSDVNVSEQTPYVKLEIQDPDLCSRYSALLIRNVKIGPSPFWMRQRLLRTGMRPINNIVDITNYVMLELGQPLHAFDYQLLQQRSGGETPTIIVRRAKEGESMQTLDGVERTLDADMLMIADTQGTLAIAGVMGGGETEVSETTTDILLESANFEFLNNRRTSQLLKLRTEASERFGKRIDPELTIPAATRAAQLMVEHAGGEIEKVYGDLYLDKKENIVIELEPTYVERLLGIEISPENIAKILESLEFQVTMGSPMQVKVPSHRMDIHIPADLVEEIARINGYNQIKPTLMGDVLPPQRHNRRLAGIERIRDILVAAGLDEIITYTIIDTQDEANLFLKSDAELSEFVPLKNPLSHEKTHLRRHLLPGALNTVRQNLRFQNRIAVFEVGAVFHPQEGELLPKEPQRLSVVLTGQRNPESWLSERDNEKLDFYDLKGVVEALLTGLHIGCNVIWKKDQSLPYHPGKCAQIFVQGESLGFIGELHPQVCRAFELPNESFCALELDLELLLKHWIEEYLMEEISHYAPIYEDLAFVVDASVPAEMVAPLMLRIGKPLLRAVELFDVFEGEKVGKDKKSLAYALTYQAFDRTLTDQDVEPIREKIIQRLQHELNATLRT